MFNGEFENIFIYTTFLSFIFVANNNENDFSNKGT